jgi:hypothetical protein
VRLLVQLDRPADHARVGGEHPAPQTFGQDQDGFLALAEHPAHRGGNAERGKELGHDHPGLHDRHRVALAARQPEGARLVRRHPLEQRRPRPPVEQVGHRDPTRLAVDRRLMQLDEAAWVGVRQRLEQQRVNGGERARVRPCAEREDEDDRNRRRRRAKKGSNGLSKLGRHGSFYATSSASPAS